MLCNPIKLKRTDVFRGMRLFSIRIIQGDATKSQIFDESGLGLAHRRNQDRCDILITDPPYCLLERKRLSGELRDEKMRRRKTEYQEEVPRFVNLAAYRDFTNKWIRNCLIHGLKDHAPLIIWTNPLGKSVILDICGSYGYELIGEYQWAKTTTAKSRSSESLLRLYESALVLFKNSKQADSIYRIEGDRIILKSRSLRLEEIPWSFISDYHGVVDQGKPHPHPCYKPSEVLKPLIATWTSPNDMILDVFSGSGSAAMTVKSLGEGRQLFGVEILDNWVNKSKQLNFPP